MSRVSKSARKATQGNKAPPHWRKVYEHVKNMRSQYIAPVDTMGCERLADNPANVSAATLRYQHLVALMLSSQTKDEVNAMAMSKLRAGLRDRGGLCVDAMLQVSDAELDAMIRQVGFHNRKTVYLKKTAAILREKHADDIPHTIEEMLELPGVGKKMAYLLMQCAWNRVEGLGVDVHVHRLSNLWGWVRAATPEQTRVALESWLPRELWGEFNPTLVGFGQTVCLPRGSRCDVCTLAPTGLCPGVSAKKMGRTATLGRGVLRDETGEAVKRESSLGYWGKMLEGSETSETSGVKAETSETSVLIDVEDLAQAVRITRSAARRRGGPRRLSTR